MQIPPDVELPADGARWVSEWAVTEVSSVDGDGNGTEPSPYWARWYVTKGCEDDECCQFEYPVLVPVDAG